MPDTRLVPDVSPPDSVQEPVRLFLSMFRRMAACGIDDALCMTWAMGSFGAGYRRPLLMIRLLVTELSRQSQRRITISAPCCCRLSQDERLLLMVLTSGERHGDRHRDMLRQLTGSEQADALLPCLEALRQSFADLGRPLTGLFARRFALAR